MRKLVTSILILSVMLCLAACCGNVLKTSGVRPRVVSRIAISCDGETRICTSDESMEAILAYLRLLSPVSTGNPTATQGPLYRIRLIHSDGSQKDYCQQGCCFREGDGDWKTITERDALALSKLFDLLESQADPFDYELKEGFT